MNNKTPKIKKHRQENWKNLELKLDESLKLDIYSHLKNWINEWAILSNKKSVIWWWQAKNIYKNPLLR